MQIGLVRFHAVYSLVLDHLSLRVLQAPRFGCVFVQAVQQVQRVLDRLVGGVLIQRRLALVDLDHILLG